MRVKQWAQQKLVRALPWTQTHQKREEMVLKAENMSGFYNVLMKMILMSRSVGVRYILHVRVQCKERKKREGKLVRGLTFCM